MANHGPHRARSDREIGEVWFNLVSRQRALDKGSQCLLDQRPAVLASHNHRALDLPRLDHASRHGQGVKKAQAGIRDIENLRRARQSDLLVRE